MDEKDASQPHAVQDVGDDSSLEKQDKEVMAQMGKKQQMPRRFNVITLLGLSLTFLSSWEAVGASMGVGLTAGGPVALVYGFLFVIAGTLACAASVAEMASICPISGAQYHWTYMFAPREWKVFLSFMQGKGAASSQYTSVDPEAGWTTVFAWQATITSLTFLMAGQLQGTIVFSNSTYVPERWHTMLIMWLVVLVAWV